MIKMDLKQYAREALAAAKVDLCRDKYLIPVAFVVTEQEIFDFNLQFENAEEKARVYSELVDIAKRKRASAIITLNDASLKDPPHGSSECLFVTLSGPAVQTWSASIPYSRIGGEIEFGSPTETVNDVLNLLPGWPAAKSLQ